MVTMPEIDELREALLKANVHHNTVIHDAALSFMRLLSLHGEDEVSSLMEGCIISEDDNYGPDGL